MSAFVEIGAVHASREPALICGEIPQATVLGFVVVCQRTIGHEAEDSTVPASPQHACLTPDGVLVTWVGNVMTAVSVDVPDGIGHASQR